ncbi:hypothetical protein DR64_3607 [Paraburkholderia xenovorans LB400]|uniref:Exported protein n=1 Tax=Paraburkholderia xenovorans (strain LB400) TaxID=266265 RepID=Q13WM7_PARXL|nr:DUF2844 domain-containing protein [Paraburkholderia xenovorans]ABE31512.1 Putative exported protein [Paraburkholderia xenovorans LB400]AIP29602.1 hypothetical protein DR64_3607 [Paraburkholderia xenovorans LB400]NPT34984.1 DUF2844 domain-containing protein [Paraburkholderia xenovorans]
MPLPIFPPIFAACAIAVAVSCVSTEARAQLGGAMPVQADSNATAPRSLLNGALRMRTLTDAGNTTINEYATNTGQIIAYTWQGPTMPDLRALLGTYADSYRAGAEAAGADGNLHVSRVARPDVVVESGGPMRGYVGRAWLPTALPAGVTADDFQ